jgi:hypothetical protein
MRKGLPKLDQVFYFTKKTYKANWITKASAEHSERQKLATIIKRLQKHAGHFEILEKQKKVFHMLFRK